jgi:cytochrome c-type biogenesis protein CcmF
VMMQEKRGMMKVWNVWLVFCTFLLCILGTFLTRSGIVSSVHAFAQSSIGSWFVGFLVVIISVCLGAYLKNRDYLKSENQLDSIVSRESSFLFNNLILLVSCVAILSGTLFPVFSEWITGNRISVGAPFFNKVNIPIGLLLLFLTGVGPLLAWRKTSTESMKRNFGWPLGIGLIAGVIALVFGFREIYSWVCLILCVFVASTVGLEFYRGAKVIRARSGATYLASAVDLTMRNTRRYGGYIVHMGMVFVFIGLSGAAFNRDLQKDMQVGQTMQIGPYSLLLQGFDSRPEKNYTAQRMLVEVLRDKKPIMMLYPERRHFSTNEQNGTMVAIYSTLKQDLYVVYAGDSPDTQLPVLHAYLNPLVKWIWLGGAVVVFGTLVAMLPNRRAVLVLAGAPQPATQQLTHGLTPSVTMRDGHD